MDRWRNRPAADLVVLALTVIVGLVIVLTMAAVLVVKLNNPEADTSNAVRSVFDVTASLVTGIVGYIGGRSVTKKEEP